jgi:CRISPR-associated protein Csb1
MANRLEATCWDSATNKPVAPLEGISHVTVTRKGEFLTDSMLEAHRLNSVYIERSKGDFFTKTLPNAIGASKEEPVDRKKLVEALLKFDVGCLIHGVFLESLDGRLRIARALSAFIEASGIQVAPSGGVKNDRVKATKNVEGGKTSKEGFGNVPFARDEYVAETINLYINLDLAQIRGYGLGEKVERLLILLALFKVRKLIEGDLRLRTACDLEPLDRDNIVANRLAEFKLPSLTDLESAVRAAIAECKGLMVHTTVTFEDDLKKAKDEKKPKEEDADNSGEDEDNTENDE